MSKRAKIDETKTHFKVILFYRRSYIPKFRTLEQAKAFLGCKVALNESTEFYAEVWKMDNEYDGEQVSLTDGSGVTYVRD